MNNLKKKLKKQHGFTLIEMLIVVAIIAILIAVSIPLVSTALEKAREATDAANERAAIALGTIAFASNEPGSAEAIAQGISTAGGEAYYIVTPASASGASSTGQLKAGFDISNPYGKGTEAGDVAQSRVGFILKVTANKNDGTVTVTWVNSAT